MTLIQLKNQVDCLIRNNPGYEDSQVMITDNNHRATSISSNLKIEFFDSDTGRIENSKEIDDFNVESVITIECGF
jgi:hypothetical protein